MIFISVVCLAQLFILNKNAWVTFLNPDVGGRLSIEGQNNDLIIFHCRVGSNLKVSGR